MRMSMDRSCRGKGTFREILEKQLWRDEKWGLDTFGGNTKIGLLSLFA